MPCFLLQSIPIVQQLPDPALRVISVHDLVRGNLNTLSSGIISHITKYERRWKTINKKHNEQVFISPMWRFLDYAFMRNVVERYLFPNLIFFSLS